MPPLLLQAVQKQSIAFMLDVERSSDPRQEASVWHPHSGPRDYQSTVRGGWLADEVGMGKSAYTGLQPAPLDFRPRPMSA